MAFNWTLSNFTETEMEINLQFENVFIISTEDEPNMMRVYFWNTKMFARKNDSIEIDLGTKLDIELKRQVTLAAKE